MLIFLLKELFRHYIANGSFMYVIMLDASKAIDKVNHSKLLTKLIDRGCPSFIVSILYYQYSTQKFTVRWCRSFYEFFIISNGVKQGGILSPHLFNVYMDDLSVNLNKLQIGCLYAGTIMNHMMYADDRYVCGLGSSYQWSPTRFSDCLFLIYINDLPNNLKSTVRLFADDTIIYMTISNGTDATALQQDLDKLAKWEETWQMEFHPQKCSVLHITRSRNPKYKQYTLHGHILVKEGNVKYLGPVLE